MVETSRNLGIFLLGDLPPAQIAETAKLVEEAGFKELWIIEDYFMLSAFATSGIALQATKTIKVGIGAIGNRVPASSSRGDGSDDVGGRLPWPLPRSRAGARPSVLDEATGPLSEIATHVDD